MYAGWVDNPMAFFDYVEANLGPPPSTEHSIDRVDNGTSDSGGPGYVPGNITWASKLQQTLNRRTTRFYTHEGQTLCLAHWARYIGISPQCLRHRLAIGTPFEQAINTPVGAL
jgi:hypothetical protein